MAAPRLGSVNVVLPDVAGAGTFLRQLGVDMGASFGEWDPHHQTLAREASGIDLDLDSPAFAGWWGGVPGSAAPTVVVNLDVGERDDVDRLHARALELGAEEFKAPWDAFWGARYSVVRAPGPLCIGLMSRPDPIQRTPGPEVADFA